MDSVASLLPKVLKKRGLYGHAVAGLVIVKTTEWIGEHLAGVASALHPRTLEKGGTLVIFADHAAALVAMHEVKHDLFAFLDTSLPDAQVRDIAVRRS